MTNRDIDRIYNLLLNTIEIIKDETIGMDNFYIKCFDIDNKCYWHHFYDEKERDYYFDLIVSLINPPPST